jgi:hypothetical protein
VAEKIPMQFATPVWAVKQKEMEKANRFMFHPFLKMTLIFLWYSHVTKPVGLFFFTSLY